MTRLTRFLTRSRLERAAYREAIFGREGCVMKQDPQVTEYRWTSYSWRDLLLLGGSLVLIALGVILGMSGSG